MKRFQHKVQISSVISKYACLFLALIAMTSCGKKSSADADRKSDSVATTVSEDYMSDKQGVIFGVPIHLDEPTAIKELTAAGILKCDEVREMNGKFTGATVEFAGVKFGMNRNFYFLTSRHDKQAIDSLVTKISSYYGSPEIDDNGSPEDNYYHWNLYDTIPTHPHIRIRPLHTEEGGLAMFWEF